MFPFLSNIFLNRNSQRNIYLQLCDQIIALIKSGKLAPSSKLPGSRTMADHLQIHRKTVVASYDELIIQGWIETIPSKGTFVSSTLPIINAEKITTVQRSKKNNTCDFTFKKFTNLEIKYSSEKNLVLKIDDGSPDHRLAPIDELSRIYRNIVRKEIYKDLFAYSSVYGNIELRKALVDYLHQTRGLQIDVDQILITRGSQMGIYLTSHLLFKNNEVILVGETNYVTANNTFELAGAKIKTIPVDKEGIQTEHIEILCKTMQIRAVYVTSHHHHPTTVTLSAKRRMHLLQLAKTHNFAIIEDDYDYDFHYNHTPILPLASNDSSGNVIYLGGFTKIIAPAIRIGFLIAPKDFIDAASRLRRVLDRQGDTILEQTLARMIRQGHIQRHSNKVLKIYKERRDLFCSLFKEKLAPYFDFDIPQGGMAVWVRLHKKYNWDMIVSKALVHGVELNPEWRRYDPNKLGHNGLRMGFAGLNNEEIITLVTTLEKVFMEL